MRQSPAMCQAPLKPHGGEEQRKKQIWKWAQIKEGRLPTALSVPHQRRWKRRRGRGADGHWRRFGEGRSISAGRGEAGRLYVELRQEALRAEETAGAEVPQGRSIKTSVRKIHSHVQQVIYPGSKGHRRRECQATQMQPQGDGQFCRVPGR